VQRKKAKADAAMEIQLELAHRDFISLLLPSDSRNTRYERLRKFCSWLCSI